MWYGSIEMIEELIRERHRAALHDALIAEARRGRRSAGSAGGPVRHALALGFAGVSRLSAAAVRRLDGCLADDLGRRMVTVDRT
jgi:hypothetical protein